MKTKILLALGSYFFIINALANLNRNPFLFSKVKSLVFQVKTSQSAHSAKTSYGTGFVVDESGLLLTNYHVISTVVQDKYNRYKIFVVDKGKSYQAEIIKF